MARCRSLLPRAVPSLARRAGRTGGMIRPLDQTRFAVDQLSARSCRGRAMMDHLASHRDRLPPHAIDAQEQIQDRTSRRNEPDDKKPKGGSTWLALVNNCVSRSDQRSREDDRADYNLKQCHPRISSRPYITANNIATGQSPSDLNSVCVPREVRRWSGGKSNGSHRPYQIISRGWRFDGGGNKRSNSASWLEVNS